MRILLVSATAAEIAPLVARLRHEADRSPVLSTFSAGAHRIDRLVAGVGMVATAAWTSRALAAGAYDLALCLGVCGSFNAAYPPGAVVHVVDDRLVELGAEDGDRFLTLEELGLLGPDDFPFRGGRLVNASPPALPALAALPAVHGITVSTAHGRERSIAEVRARVAPDVESMEGAAFMYACLIQGIPFAQVRAVSNVVERRDRAAWRLGDAVAALDAAAWRILQECA